MSTLVVTVVQADLLWQDAAGNRRHFTTVIEDLQEPADLIVLPEMFTTGFSMDAPELAETMDGDSVAWMRKMAASSNAAVCGSLIIAENQQFYNRFICASPAGDLLCYDKRHLFRLADEQLLVAGTGPRHRRHAHRRDALPRPEVVPGQGARRGPPRSRCHGIRVQVVRLPGDPGRTGLSRCPGPTQDPGSAHAGAYRHRQRGSRRGSGGGSGSPEERREAPRGRHRHRRGRQRAVAQEGLDQERGRRCRRPSGQER